MGGKAVGYLTSVYPALSHTFIFREIRALRALGLVVKTASIRQPADLDRMTPGERAESGPTWCVNRTPVARVIAVHLRLAATRPLRYLHALRQAWRLHRLGPVPTLKMAAYFAQAGLLLDWMRRENIGHLHVHFGNPPATAALLAEHMGGAPFSLSIHGPDIFNEENTSLLAEKTGRAVFVRCISYFCRSQVMRLARFEHWSKLHIVHCGIDPADFPPRPAPNNAEPEIVCVGRLVAAKGQYVLLQACRELLDRGLRTHVTFLGDGPERTRLEMAAAELGVDGMVTFAGAVGQDVVRAGLERADMMVLPSFAEGLPVVLMEAMAMEVPCVSTRIMGIPELIEDGVNGFLVPASDSRALADKIETLVRDPMLRAEFGRRARRAVLQGFVMEECGRAMHGLFMRYAPETAIHTGGQAS